MNSGFDYSIPRTIFRLIWRGILLGLIVLIGAGLCAFYFPLVNLHRRGIVIQWWSRAMLFASGVSKKIIQLGEAKAADLTATFKKHPFVVIANHVSWLDILMIQALMPVSFIAKAELARWPVAGFLIKSVGSIFITRENKRQLLDINVQLSEVARKSTNAWPVAFFPEGRVAPPGSLLPFKSNLFEFVHETKLAVLPMGVRYLNRNGAVKTEINYADCGFFINLWRVLRCNIRGEILLTTLITTETFPMKDRRELCREVENMIVAAHIR